MSRFRLICLCSAVLAAMAAAVSVHAETKNKGDALNLSLVRRLDPGASTENEAGMTYFSSFEQIATPNESVKLIDDAEVRRGGVVLRADSITYTFSSDEVYANGNALVAKSGAVFEGPWLSYKLDAQTGQMPEAKFRYLPSSLRGSSEKVELLGDGQAKMCNAIITSCEEGSNAWWISAETLDVDQVDESATGHNAKLYIGGIPVFASPYLTFPISDKRRTGFLTPKFGMNSNLGVNLDIPWYWNIAPNYDYTITAKPMTKRGLMIANEFRYLQPSFGGEVKYEVLFKDRETDHYRYSLDIKHYQRFGENGPHLGVDYQKVSDNNYLSDFSTTIRESSENILPQNVWLSFNRTYWSSSLGVYKNQTLRPDNWWTEQPYEKEPEFNLSAFVADYHGFQFSSRLTATRFKMGDNDHIGRSASGDGDRTMINSSVSYPMQGSYWFLTPKAEYSMVWYSNIKNATADIDKSSHRMLPIFSIDGGLIFERNTTLFGRATDQTLEPRLFYVYIPYRDQSRMPNFESSDADLNFAELFSPNRYTGYDRISNANQLAGTLTTRFIDSETGEEWFNATVGQRYYFEDQKVGLFWSNPGTTQNKSDLLAATQFTLTKGLKAEMAIQYSSAWSKLSKATAGFRYHPQDHSTISLYYQYNYNPNDTRVEYYNTNIEQIDLGVQWPVKKDLYAVGRYNYSLRSKKVIESLIGLEYRAGCWILRGAIQRYVRSENRTTTNFFLELELVGLGSFGSSPIQALGEGIIGYQPIGPKPVEVGRYDYYE